MARRRRLLSKSQARQLLRTLRSVQYLRVSSERQAKKYGPASQRDDIEQAVTEWELMPPSATYEDHISARGEVTRTDFERMLADAKLGKFQILLVGRVDRFARNERDGWNYLHDLIEAGAVVYFCDDDCAAGLDEDWEEEVSDKLTAAANWSRTISKNLKKAYRAARAAGEYTGRKAPWGYRKTADKRLEFDPDQIDGLRYAIEATLENRRVLGEIADDLTVKGYRPRGRRITKRLLLRALRNPLLKGSWQVHIGTPEYKELKNCAPRLVSDSDYERIGAILAARSGGATGHKRNMRRTHPYVLVSLLRCGECGESLVGGGATRSSKGRLNLYYDHVDRGCGENNPDFRPSFREDRLLEQLDPLFAHLALPADATARIRAFLASERPQPADPTILRGRLDDDLERADRSFRRGGYGQDPASAERAWLAERNAILAKIAEIPEVSGPATADVAAVLELNAVWKRSDAEGKRLLVERLIDRIEVRRLGPASGPGAWLKRDDRITKIVPRAQFQLLLACALDAGMCGSGCRCAHDSTVVGLAEFRVWRSRIGRPEAA